MAESLPQIYVTSSREQTNGTRSPAPSPGVDNGNALDSSNAVKDGRIKTGDSSEGISKSFPTKLIRTLSSSNHAAPPVSAGTDGTALPTAIDPLSQHIMERTQTGDMSLPRTRTTSFPISKTETPESNSVVLSADGSGARADGLDVGAKDKKKGGFLSRFIKKKDPAFDIPDDESEIGGDKRTEGTDADVFSHPIGFIPRFPAPPKYIKVRSRGKKEKEFNRMFLAQQLRGRTGVEIAQAGGRAVGSNGPVQRPPVVSQSKGPGQGIWAMGFSKDGKYLAAGGLDRVLRVWAVIANEEDRHAHEHEEDAGAKNGESMRLTAPVFKTIPVQEYEGHTGSILDLSWSKNNFLLSSSMDKTVRLWHISRAECLCCFKHNDFVTSIEFHPRDDRFFLAGSLDSKIRLWSIPDKSVAYFVQLTDLVTAVAFTPDGKTCIAGCLNGLCLFYETEGLKYQTQIHVRSAHGKNAKGSKITGIQTIVYPPNDPHGEVKILISSNDSRIRVYNFRDKGLELKLKGNENAVSQIRANFSDDARYVICGSEDKKTFIWPTITPEKDREKQPVETFEPHDASVTSAIFAPTKTRQLLQYSGDPLFELCNPPPVVLASRTDSQTTSSRPASESGRFIDDLVSLTPLTSAESNTPNPNQTPIPKPEETPAFVSRSGHPDGNIIVTADYMGHISVFRQDCAYKKRLRAENFSDSKSYKKALNRSSSIITKGSRSSVRESSFSHPAGSDRILSWRQSIERNNASADTFPSPRAGTVNRAPSPRKSSNLGHQSMSTTSSIRPGNSRASTQGLGITNSASTSALIAPAMTTTTAVTTPTTASTTPSEPPNLPRTTSSINGIENSIPSPQERGKSVFSQSGSLPIRTGPLGGDLSDPLMRVGDHSMLYYKQAREADQSMSSIQRMRTIDPDGGGSDSRSRASSYVGGSLSPGHLGGLRGRTSEEGRVSLLSDDSEYRRGSEGRSEDGRRGSVGVGMRNGSAGGEEGDGDGEVKCRTCGSDRFKARTGKKGHELFCGVCGTVV
ncbi:hypothetical protein MMC25_002599 [Agyrium rufum]|nr:hypothetical protein [Agyrium rufum]